MNKWRVVVSVSREINWFSSKNGVQQAKCGNNYCRNPEKLNNQKTYRCSKLYKQFGDIVHISEDAKALRKGDQDARFTQRSSRRVTDAHKASFLIFTYGRDIVMQTTYVVEVVQRALSRGHPEHQMLHMETANGSGIGASVCINDVCFHSQTVHLESKRRNMEQIVTWGVRGTEVGIKIEETGEN